MKYLIDKWEVAIVLMAILLVGFGGHIRSNQIDSRLERFERRLFNSTWRISGNEIHCDPPKE